jgi:hypothetical protein
MPDDVILGKSEIIEHCLARVRETYARDPAALEKDYGEAFAIVKALIDRDCQRIEIPPHAVNAVLVYILFHSIKYVSMLHDQKELN